MEKTYVPETGFPHFIKPYRWRTAGMWGLAFGCILLPPAVGIGITKILVNLSYFENLEVIPGWIGVMVFLSLLLSMGYCDRCPGCGCKNPLDFRKIQTQGKYCWGCGAELR